MTEGASAALARNSRAFSRSAVQGRPPAFLQAAAERPLLQLVSTLRRLRSAVVLGCLAASSGLGHAAPPASPSLDDALVGACRGCHSFGAGAATPTSVTVDAASAFVRLDQYSASTLEQKLLAYRQGDTDATLMPRIARGYSDAQLKQIAAAIAASKP